MKHEGKEKLYKISYRAVDQATPPGYSRDRVDLGRISQRTRRSQGSSSCTTVVAGQPPHSINNETRDRSAGRTRDCGCAPSPVQDYLSRIDRSGSRTMARAKSEILETRRTMTTTHRCVTVRLT